MSKKISLGVNLDHLVTIREARHTPYPDLSEAIRIAENSGADGITMHLREDRRHIQRDDVYTSREVITTALNLEMAAIDEMIAIAMDVKPDYCCIVPERREELTTEGGLDVAGHRSQLSDACDALGKAGIKVSLFIEPDEAAIDLVLSIGAPIIELHTGNYCDVEGKSLAAERQRIERVSNYAAKNGLQVNAGHGLHYGNVTPIAKIPVIQELNIGHSIIARALIVGLATAVSDMKALMISAR